MRLAPNYLERTGYRLPTEAEWEYACRAGAATSRSYGESVELLEKYGWYSDNSQARGWPVGSLKPNDLGIFDMHGNVFNWCQERYKDYAVGKKGDGMEDREDVLNVTDEETRVLRGGSFLGLSELCRCAHRDTYPPAYTLVDAGFRPARSFH